MCWLDGGSRDWAVHVGSSHAGTAPAARVPAALRRDSARGRRRRIPRAPRHTLCLQPILPVSIHLLTSEPSSSRDVCYVDVGIVDVVKQFCAE